MFIRRKQDWRQSYFYVVKAYRTENGAPRQYSVYLGRTLSLSAEEWADVLRKNCLKTEAVRDAIRNYCRKVGLPLKLGEAVRVGARLNKERGVVPGLTDAEFEDFERMLASMDAACHYSSPSRSAVVLGISPDATKDEVQAAFRKLAHIHHEDHGGNNEKFLELVAARNAMLEHLGTTRPATVVTR